MLAFVVLVAANVFYLLVVDRLGFVATAFVYLAALMWALRVRIAVVLPVAFVMALVIHWGSTSCCACRCLGASCRESRGEAGWRPGRPNAGRAPSGAANEESVGAS